MDWSRAKTILIIVLLLLNVFLLVMIMFTNPATMFSDSYRKYAIDYLKSKDIEVNADIPVISKQVGRIIYISREYDPQKLCKLVFGGIVPASFNQKEFYIENGEESIGLSEDVLLIKDKLNDGRDLYSDPDKFGKRLMDYLKELGFSKNSIIMGDMEEKDGSIQITFNLKYKNSVVFDQTITARLNSEGLLTLWAPTKDVSKGNGASEILSAYQVLVTAGLPSGTRIEHVDFGYKQISEGDIYGNPVWRVILNDGTVMYYNAYTGVKL
ncbi:MAG TPA: hypothetical protein GXX26_00485 [Clostridiaceae bacterium]|nr:hypothetical protein [Clostridiaceae bacterium]